MEALEGHISCQHLKLTIQPMTAPLLKVEFEIIQMTMKQKERHLITKWGSIDVSTLIQGRTCGTGSLVQAVGVNSLQLN
jgi:hypothetical protein